MAFHIKIDGVTMVAVWPAVSVQITRRRLPDEAVPNELLERSRFLTARAEDNAT